MKIRINHDVYNISKRIKEIDKDYYIVFDTSKNKFEIHNSSQLFNTYCVTIPYNTLDNRALDYVNMTRSSNMETILEDIDRDNKLRENADKSCVLSQFNQSIIDGLKRR